MEIAERVDFVTVEDYLAAEERSDARHEYLGGLVYAMAGKTRDHNRIVGNLYKAIDRHVAGGPCQIYFSDVRVNFDLRNDDYFYNPDLVVTWDKRDTHPRFVRHPKLIIEVLSPSTERVDKREKFLTYTTIESLEEYVLVAQDTKEVTVRRRANDWRKEVVTGLPAPATFASLGCAVPLAAIYEGVGAS